MFFNFLQHETNNKELVVRLVRMEPTEKQKLAYAKRMNNSLAVVNSSGNQASIKPLVTVSVFSTEEENVHNTYISIIYLLINYFITQFDVPIYLEILNLLLFMLLLLCLISNYDFFRFSHHLLELYLHYFQMISAIVVWMLKILPSRKGRKICKHN